MNNVAALPTENKKSLVVTFAERLGVDAEKLLPALKQTAFQVKNQEITESQMMALLVVSNQYGLNPFTKEIYAYPDKGGIVPVVSVDGWSRIINENPKADGVEFEYSPETITFEGHTCHVWIDCIMHRKDRSHPTRVREFFNEVKRDLSYSNPWKSHPNRMHRHKALIQAARVAFGFAGIYDQDEAERIVEAKKVEAHNPADGLKEPYNQDQHDYFHSLIAEKNAIEFFVFIKSIPEGVVISLYDSFEKGQKTASKKIANDLERDGNDLLDQIAAEIHDAAEANDDVALIEAIGGLSDDAIAMVLDRATPLANSFYREVSKV